MFNQSIIVSFAKSALWMNIIIMSDYKIGVCLTSCVKMLFSSQNMTCAEKSTYATSKTQRYSQWPISVEQ